MKQTIPNKTNEPRTYIGLRVQAKCFNYKTGIIIGYNPAKKQGKYWKVQFETPYTYAGKDCYIGWMNGNSLVPVPITKVYTDTSKSENGKLLAALEEHSIQPGLQAKKDNN